MGKVTMTMMLGRRPCNGGTIAWHIVHPSDRDGLEQLAHLRHRRYLESPEGTDANIVQKHVNRTGGVGQGRDAWLTGDVVRQTRKRLVSPVNAAGSDRRIVAIAFQPCAKKCSAIALRARPYRSPSPGRGDAGIGDMSRLAFFARFSQLNGCAPSEYLAGRRTALAKEAQVRGGKSLDRIAEEIGYESARTFSSSF